jgi:hypothetical protein
MGTVGPGRTALGAVDDATAGGQAEKGQIRRALSKYKGAFWGWNMKIRRHVGADDRQQLAIAGQKPNWDKLYILSVLVENFTENLFPGGGVQPQPVAGVVVKLAGRQSPDAPETTVVELVVEVRSMANGFDRPSGT